MKDEELAKLAERIREELGEISRVVTRTSEGWERARRSNDDYYLDGVALNLHGFYSGFERIFAQIAEVVEGDLPHGENWHQQLLQRMMSDVPKVRPAVISKETGAKCIHQGMVEQKPFSTETPRHRVFLWFSPCFRDSVVRKSVQPIPDHYKLLAFAAFLEQ
jgi:hypothetical protein